MQIMPPVLMPIWMVIVMIVGILLVSAWLLRTFLVTRRDTSLEVGDIPMAPGERRQWGERLTEIADWQHPPLPPPTTMKSTSSVTRLSLMLSCLLLDVIPGVTRTWMAMPLTCRADPGSRSGCLPACLRMPAHAGCTRRNAVKAFSSAAAATSRSGRCWCHRADRGPSCG